VWYIKKNGEPDVPYTFEGHVGQLREYIAELERVRQRG